MCWQYLGLAPAVGCLPPYCVPISNTARAAAIIFMISCFPQFIVYLLYGDLVLAMSNLGGGSVLGISINVLASGGSGMPKTMEGYKASGALMIVAGVTFLLAFLACIVLSILAVTSPANFQARFSRTMWLGHSLVLITGHLVGFIGSAIVAPIGVIAVPIIFFPFDLYWNFIFWSFSGGKSAPSTSGPGGFTAALPSAPVSGYTQGTAAKPPPAAVTTQMFPGQPAAGGPYPGRPMMPPGMAPPPGMYPGMMPPGFHPGRH
jgi:hypothetical protein